MKKNLAALCAILVTATGLQAVTASAAAAADPREVKVIPADLPVNAGLTISQGVVRHIQTDGSGDHRLFNHSLAAWTDATPALDGGRLTDPVPCQAGTACVRTVDSNRFGTSYLGTDATGRVRLFSRADAATAETSTAAGSATTLVDASASFAVTRSADGTQQFLIRPGSTGATPESIPARPAAVFEGRLWTAAGTSLTAEQRPNLSSITYTGVSACTIDEIQATHRYVYWSCGAQGGAGIFDQRAGRSTLLPAGRYLLGDGYAVRHDAETGDLLRYDVTSGTAGAPVKLATFSSGTLADDRNITWAVDKFGGNVAYVDAANAVHVIDPGVAQPAPAVLVRNYGANGAGVSFPGSANPRPLQPVWTLTRPVDSWTFTVTRLAGGQTVATKTGGPVRASLATTWDGLLASGAKAPSGRYTYTLAATAGGVTTTISTDTVQVFCGAPRHRSFGCGGDSAVLQVLSNGEGHWQILRDGTIRDNGPTDTWALASGSTIVPFGDLNGDGRNDLLARNASGVLSVHHGTTETRFNSTADKVVGSGWGGMRQILTSGDLTSDGIADVLAQDSAGVLRRYAGTAAGGIANGVVVPGTWNQPKLIGPGDVTGDGRADLYAVDAAGVLNLHHGIGNGTFGPAERIGSGWAPYTILSAGDATEDNRNDLVARDTSNILWLYPGNGTGGFGTRKQLATVDGRIF